MKSTHNPDKPNPIQWIKLILPQKWHLALSRLMQFLHSILRWISWLS